MRRLPTPPLRQTAASRLRALADQLSPLKPVRSPPPAAPLVRLGGRWWLRDELVGERAGPEA